MLDAATMGTLRLADSECHSTASAGFEFDVSFAPLAVAVRFFSKLLPDFRSTDTVTSYKKVG